MGRQRRALIVGGSMSGLLAGIMLARRGWEVDIFERAEGELAGRGAGIVAQPELIARIEALGLDTSNLGVAVTTRQILDRAGRVTTTRECPQVMTAWERVYRLLREGFPRECYHRGCGLQEIVQSADSVRARFSDGKTIEADVLIGADGLRSTVRQHCQPEVVPLYAGYVAWRALIPERAIPPDLHRQLFATMMFCLPPGEQFLGYPVAGPDNELRDGQRRYNAVWYRPADEATELPALLTGSDGVTYSISIPPPRLRSEPVAAMRAAAERLLAPQCCALVRLFDEPILQPIYDLETPQLAFGRIALVGDAACVARPHVGAGVAKAADDAAALADALDGDDIEAALRRFEAQRLPDNKKIVARARHLGAYLQASQTEAERASSARHGVPEAVLAETALLDFLRG
jgi:2-polyprenyl-6-methoxyphenol hydroxylase-like FAD-dependent oxidoreductase